MKSTIIAGALVTLLSSTAVQAQTEIRKSEPFFLKVVSATNATLNGRYLTACHAGAALETLCVDKTDIPTTNPAYGTFYLNTTVWAGVEQEAGTLVWDLRLADGMVVPSAMDLRYSPGTNVAQTWVTPSVSTTSVGFNGTSMYVSAYPDDSTFVDGVYPEPLSQSGRQVTSWYSCWVMAGSYFYNALTLVTGGVPRNPTCQAVSVVRVPVKA